MNVVDAGYDLAIRFSAPTYLDLRGRPGTLDDLLKHDVISSGDPPNTQWVFADGLSVNVVSKLAFVWTFLRGV